VADRDRALGNVLVNLGRALRAQLRVPQAEECEARARLLLGEAAGQTPAATPEPGPAP
jgi:hypothetical protein